MTESFSVAFILLLYFYLFFMPFNCNYLMIPVKLNQTRFPGAHACVI